MEKGFIEEIKKKELLDKCDKWGISKEQLAEIFEIDIWKLRNDYIWNNIVKKQLPAEINSYKISGVELQKLIMSNINLLKDHKSTIQEKELLFNFRLFLAQKNSKK